MRRSTTRRKRRSRVRSRRRSTKARRSRQKKVRSRQKKVRSRRRASRRMRMKDKDPSRRLHRGTGRSSKRQKVHPDAHQSELASLRKQITILEAQERALRSGSEASASPAPPAPGFLDGVFGELVTTPPAPAVFVSRAGSTRLAPRTGRAFLPSSGATESSTATSPPRSPPLSPLLPGRGGGSDRMTRSLSLGSAADMLDYLDHEPFSDSRDVHIAGAHESHESHVPLRLRRSRSNASTGSFDLGDL